MVATHKSLQQSFRVLPPPRATLDPVRGSSAPVRLTTSRLRVAQVGQTQIAIGDERLHGRPEQERIGKQGPAVEPIKQTAAPNVASSHGFRFSSERARR